MSGVGFSVTAGAGVELSKQYEMFDFQKAFADRTIANDQKIARIAAVAQVLSAYIAVNKVPPSAEQLKKWATEVGPIIGAVS